MASERNQEFFKVNPCEINSMINELFYSNKSFTIEEIENIISNTRNPSEYILARQLLILMDKKDDNFEYQKMVDELTLQNQELIDINTKLLEMVSNLLLMCDNEKLGEVKPESNIDGLEFIGAIKVYKLA